MPSCLIPQPIHQSGHDALREAGLQILVGESACAEACPEQVVAAVYRSGRFSGTDMARYPHLRVIGVHGVGVDGIELSAASEQGILVFNTPGMNHRSVAEHALGLMFALAKRIPACDRATREGRFDIRFEGGLRELHGLRLGILGFGAIGQETARLAVALGMQVMVHSRRGASELAASGVIRADSLDQLLRSSDIVSLHLPACADTVGLIGARELASMKRNAWLINTGRGAVVDEPALIAALADGVIGGAGLDVFHSECMAPGYPLLDLPNVVLTPHTGASTEQALIRMADAVARGVTDALRGEVPVRLVNVDAWERRRRALW